MRASVREYVPLAPFTTLGVGGPARYFIRADSENTVLEASGFANDKGLPLLVLGGGSNLLISDEGFPGVVMRIEIRGLEWRDDGQRVRLISGAGEDWDEVVAQCVGRGLYGVECLSGIPGSVGGTPVQNVGAYGQEVSETLLRVRVYDRQAGTTLDLDHAQCGFSYRTSIFNTTASGRYVVMEVEYALPRTGNSSLTYADVKNELAEVPSPTLLQVRDAVLRIRARKAMVLSAGDPDCRSAGSFFKNPIIGSEKLAEIETTAGEKPPRYPAAGGMVKTAAAWLIERAGISRGFSMGRAGVSTKHTLALINKGGATAQDIDHAGEGDPPASRRPVRRAAHARTCLCRL